MTLYVVFRRVKELPAGAPPTYERLGQAEAHDAKDAIGRVIKELPEEQQKEANESSFAAAPARSWVEASPEVQLELKVRVR